MGLLDIFKKKKRTLMQDIPVATDWIVTALNYSKYKADFTLESMKEIDRFFDEQNQPGGILTDGSIIFPVQRVTKRYKLGTEESIFAYAYAIGEKFK